MSVETYSTFMYKKFSVLRKAIGPPLGYMRQVKSVFLYLSRRDNRFIVK